MPDDRIETRVSGASPNPGALVSLLVGDFTDWQGVPMTRQDDGSWRNTLALPPREGSWLAMPQALKTHPFQPLLRLTRPARRSGSA
jgi:hypothetical protein